MQGLRKMNVKNYKLNKRQNLDHYEAFVFHVLRKCYFAYQFKIFLNHNIINKFIYFDLILVTFLNFEVHAC